MGTRGSVRRGDTFTLARIMRVLAKETHVEVLASVALSPKANGAIAEQLGLEASAISKRTGPLRHLGLLEMSRHKNSHVFRVNPARVYVNDRFELHVSVSSSDGGRIEFWRPLSSFMSLAPEISAFRAESQSSTERARSGERSPEDSSRRTSPDDRPPRSAPSGQARSQPHPPRRR